MTRIRDGDLYRVIEVHGVTFKIYYGYYDERDRYAPMSEPIPIYPDFLAEPRYTKEGYPFTTGMQDICEHYQGRSGGETCISCPYYKEAEDLIGICQCKERKSKLDFSEETK